MASIFSDLLLVAGRFYAMLKALMAVIALRLGAAVLFPSSLSRAWSGQERLYPLTSRSG